MALRSDRVNLTYEDEQLTGNAAGLHVELPLDVPVSSGSASGSLGGLPIRATWAIASNYRTDSQPVSFEAIYDGRATHLTTTFMLRSIGNPDLVSADITGAVGDDPVAATVAQDHRYGAFVVQGHVGSLELAIAANVEHNQAVVTGSIDGQPIKLTAKRSSGDYPGGVRIRGSWNGPPTLCLLTAACVLYFV